MIQVNKLSITQIQEDRPLIKDLSFIVNPGERIALIGEEGNGKSTLLKYLLGLPLPGFATEGNKSLDTPTGYLEQDLRSRWGETNVLDYFLLDAPEGMIEDYALLGKIPAFLEKEHFPKGSFSPEKTIAEFSGGEIVRLALAKLKLRPYRSFLLDEPSNDLDLESLSLLKDFLLSVSAPVLFVSHDERLISDCATGILHLEQLKRKTEMKATFARVPYDEYQERRQDLYEKETQVITKKEGQLQEKKERWAKIYQGVKDDQDQCVRDPETGRLLKKRMKRLLVGKKQLEKEEAAIGEKPEGDPFLNLVFPLSSIVANGKRILSFHGPLFCGGKLLIPHLDLDLVGPGQNALVGANGIGKSTLLEALYEANKGRKDIRLGYMPQNYEESFPSNGTILSFLCSDERKETATRVRLYLGSLRYTSEEMLYPLSSLSGGQKAKLFLLKMVLEEKNVLLLDEPTRNLSPFSVRMLDSLLDSFKGRALIVSHDSAFIERRHLAILSLDKNGIQAICGQG
jgi:ATPase subunit of ABC transporter with duplicated ATPase domains